MFRHRLKADGLPVKAIRSLLAILLRSPTGCCAGERPETVWEVLPLQDDAFEPEPAGVEKLCRSLNRMPVRRYVTTTRSYRCIGVCPSEPEKLTR